MFFSISHLLLRLHDFPPPCRQIKPAVPGVPPLCPVCLLRQSVNTVIAGGLSALYQLAKGLILTQLITVLHSRFHARIRSVYRSPVRSTRVSSERPNQDIEQHGKFKPGSRQTALRYRIRCYAQRPIALGVVCVFMSFLPCPVLPRLARRMSVVQGSGTSDVFHHRPSLMSCSRPALGALMHPCHNAYSYCRSRSFRSSTSCFQYFTLNKPSPSPPCQCS